MTRRTGSVREVALDMPGMIRQLEVDVGLTADAAWNMAIDTEVWRAQRPVAGQAVQTLILMRVSCFNVLRT